MLILVIYGHFWRIMMTSSNGNIFRVTGPLCGEFTSPGEFPAHRPVTRGFDVFFDLRPNKRLSKQPWGWWFETLSSSLWRHDNVKFELKHDIFKIKKKVSYLCMMNRYQGIGQNIISYQQSLLVGYLEERVKINLYLLSIGPSIAMIFVLIGGLMWTLWRRLTMLKRTAMWFRASDASKYDGLTLMQLFSKSVSRQKCLATRTHGHHLLGNWGNIKWLHLLQMMIR